MTNLAYGAGLRFAGIMNGRWRVPISIVALIALIPIANLGNAAINAIGVLIAITLIYFAPWLVAKSSSAAIISLRSS